MINEIRVEGLKRVNPKVIAESMETQVGKPLDIKVADADMRRLYGRGEFEHVGYRLIEEPGKRILVVDAVEKSWGPDYLRFGLGMSGETGGDAIFNVLGSYRKTWINRLGVEWKNEVQLGQSTLFFSEFYQPLSVQRYLFIAPMVQYDQFQRELFQGEVPFATYNNRSTTAGLDLGSQITKYGDTTFSRSWMHWGAIWSDFSGRTPAPMRVPLGTAATAGTSWPLNRRRLMELLGYDRLIENSRDAGVAKDYLIEVMAAFCGLMAHIAKTATDLWIWSTSEFAMVELDDEYTGTSSAMPQKKNNYPLEVMRYRYAQVTGDMMTVLTALKGPNSIDSESLLLDTSTDPMMHAAKYTLDTADFMLGVISTL